jgi:hypothetical protein
LLIFLCKIKSGAGLRSLFGILIFLTFNNFVFGQDPDSLQQENRDFPIYQADSIIMGKPANDSIQVADTTSQQPPDSLATPSAQIDTSVVQPRGDIATIIDYNARDSIFFDLRKQNLNMYGDTRIDYGAITLEADLTDVDLEQKVITSKYSVDSLNKKIGRPVFTDDGKVYETDNIKYNFSTKRALIKGVITEQEGAFMHGDDVKKNEDNEMFIRGARYTTCNLSHPHFFIESSKLKVIPGNKVVSGPFNLRFREVVTPLWFPFGMFPQPKRRTSGIKMPTYGEERRRGFFLRDMGYYFAISDYVDLTILADVYSQGGSGINITSNYKKRYSYNGSFNFSYNRFLSDAVEDPLATNDYWVRWSHRPESRGTSSFSASVSAGTSSYNQNNNLTNQDFNRSIRSQFASNISYSNSLPGTPFNMSLNARQNQNIQTGIMTLALPDFTLNMNRIYPFKSIIDNSKSPLAKLNFSHNFVATNELTNSAPGGFGFNVLNEPNDDTLAFNLDNLDQIYRRSKIGGRHQIPINTSISMLKVLTLNPTFNYTDYWYTRELDFRYDEQQNGVVVDTIPGFSRASSWRSGLSVNTVIYGTKFFRGGKVKAIRHVMNPQVGFSYNPDFSNERFGVYKNVQVDSLGNTRRVSKYQGFAYGSPTGNESRALTFSLQNNIELKVKDPSDSS